MHWLDASLVKRQHLLDELTWANAFSNARRCGGGVADQAGKAFCADSTACRVKSLSVPWKVDGGGVVGS